jgi:hypothetical protein
MKYLILFLFLFSQNLFADRRSELISVINEEIQEIVRLIKQSGKRPNLLLRMAELQFEKARLIKEEENKKYLAISAGERKTINKQKFFAKSLKQFKKAEKISRYLLKKYKKFKGRSDVLYILAFNAKEFGNEKGYESYLKSSVNTGAGKGVRGPMAILALGDNYYNKKKYKEAIPYYVKGLSLGTKDDWWTKYAYNLAWSYLRVNYFKKSIDLMHEIYKKSKTGKYIDMSSQVERDMGYFYTMANRVNEAVAFYKSINANLVKHFKNIAGHLEKQGKKTLALQINIETLKHGPSDRERRDITLKILDLYEQYRKYSEHYKYTRSLLKEAQEDDLSEDQKEQFLYQIKKVSSVLQKRVADLSVKLSISNRKQLANLAISYFDILIDVEKKKNYTWVFHKAETLYVNENYEEAVKNYKSSFLKARESDDKKITKLAIEGMIASVDKIKSKNPRKDSYVLDAFNTYIEFSPNSKESRKIQQRLFTFYFNKKDIQNAEKTLIVFKQNFSKDLKIQEAMLAKIMDHYKDKKDKEGISKWVTYINEGKIVVSQKYKIQLRKLLLNMKFENVEKANKDGDRKKALLGYLEIFQKSKEDKIAKKNSAYNIAVLLHEIGEVDRSYQWAKESIGLMSKRDVYSYRDSYAVMADELFNRRRFKEAIDLYSKILDKVCDYKNKIKNSIFKNIYVIKLANGDTSSISKDLQKAKKCKIRRSYRYDAMVSLVNAYLEENNYAQAEKLINFLVKTKNHKSSMVEPLYRLYQNYISLGNMKNANNVKNKILKIGSRSRNLPLEAVDIMANFKLGEVEVLGKRVMSIQLAFPENKFNSSLKLKLDNLDKFTSRALSLLRVGSGNGIVEAYKILHSTYLGFSRQIKSFTPKGKSSTYIKSFQKGLSPLIGTLEAKAKEFHGLAIKEIYRQQILSPSNHYFTSKLNLNFSLEYLNPKRGVLMDKAGKP